MKKMTLLRQLALSACLLSTQQIATAAQQTFCFFSNPTTDIKREDTYSCGRASLAANNTVINHGELIAKNIFFTEGSIINYGKLANRYELIFSSENSVITNQASGVIDTSNWLFINSGKLDNYGVVNFVPPYGNGGIFNDNELILYGTYNNFGTTRIDDNVQNMGTAGTFNNTGTFEVTPRGSLPSEMNYIQTAGETKINGTFTAENIDIQGGVLSGNGTVDGVATYLGSGATISPGAPLGTLTIVPESGAGSDFFCLGCAIEIPLSSASGAGHLHVNGSFYMHNWKLNVVLRNGYIPKLGDSFDIISANLVYGYGPAPTYNLPKLAAGLSWSVVNNGTTLSLKVK